MKIPLAAALSEWRAVYRFRSLPAERRRVVFYSEGPESAPHLAPIISELTGRLGMKICYVTSSSSDPILEQASDGLLGFQVGSGAARSYLFSTLDAGMLVTTTPDLETMQLKRSARTGRYVYVHHAIMSLHMAYRPGAFDHFDAMLCVGPHHTAEARAAERVYGLRNRELVEHGSSRLDSILAKAAVAGASRSNGGTCKVVIAPTWGDHALLESCGGQLIDLLLAAGHHVTVRPHPMTLRHRMGMMKRFESEFGARGAFRLDLETSAERSLFESDVMISDWSGVALEYAFGLEKPIVLVDLPRKVNNPDYTRLELEPLEVRLRRQIGTTVAPDELGRIPELLRVLRQGSEQNAGRLRELRRQWVYNVGRSGAAGAEYVAEAAERQAPETDRAGGEPRGRSI